MLFGARAIIREISTSVGSLTQADQSMYQTSSYCYGSGYLFANLHARGMLYPIPSETYLIGTG